MSLDERMHASSMGMPCPTTTSYSCILALQPLPHKVRILPDFFGSVAHPTSLPTVSAAAASSSSSSGPSSGVGPTGAWIVPDRPLRAIEALTSSPSVLPAAVAAVRHAIDRWEHADIVQLDTTPEVLCGISEKLFHSVSPGQYLPNGPDDPTKDRVTRIAGCLHRWSDRDVFLPGASEQDRHEALFHAKRVRCFLAFKNKGEDPFNPEAHLSVCVGPSAGCGCRHQHQPTQPETPALSLLLRAPTGTCTLSTPAAEWEAVLVSLRGLLEKDIVKKDAGLPEDTFRAVFRSCLAFARACLSTTGFEVAHGDLHEAHRRTLAHPAYEASGSVAQTSHFLLARNATRKRTCVLVADFLSGDRLAHTLSCALRHVRRCGSVQEALRDPSWFCTDLARALLATTNPSVSDEEIAPASVPWTVALRAQTAVVARREPHPSLLAVPELPLRDLPGNFRFHRGLAEASKELFAELPPKFAGFEASKGKNAVLDARLQAALPLSLHSVSSGLRQWMQAQLRSLALAATGESDVSTPSQKFVRALHALSLLAHIKPTSADTCREVATDPLEIVLGSPISNNFLLTLMLHPAALNPGTLLLASLYLAAMASDYPRSSLCLPGRDDRMTLAQACAVLAAEAGNPPYARNLAVLDDVYFSVLPIQLQKAFQAAIPDLCHIYSDPIDFMEA